MSHDQWDDSSWPVGMRPDGTLNVVTEEEAQTMLLHRDWNRHAAKFYEEFDIPQSSGEATAKLFSILLAQRNRPPGEWTPPQNIVRAMALDAMVANFPESSPPSQRLIDMMKLALGLPDYHSASDWLFADEE